MGTRRGLRPTLEGQAFMALTREVEIYPKTGTPYTLRPKKAGSPSPPEIEAIGSVVVETDDGYRLITDRLRYMMKTKELTTGSMSR